MRRLVLAAALCAALAAYADGKSDVVTLSNVTADMESITDPLTVRVQLQADPAADLIYKINLNVPSELAAGRAAQPEPRFFDYRTKALVTGLPAMTSGRWSPETLFYRSRPVPLSLTLTYCLRTDNPQVAEITFPVTPRGPLAGILLGGILGVLSVVVLRLAYRQAKGGSAAVFTRRGLARAGSSALLGIVAVTIALLVLRENPEQFGKLPVTIDVKDAIGAFVVGLFFEPLSQLLAKKLWGEGEPKEPEKPEKPEKPKAEPAPAPA